MRIARVFLLPLLPALLAGAWASAAAPDDQEARFHRLDTSGDGFVDRAEHEAGVRADFAQADLNHDGFIDLAEYQRWLEQHVQGAEGRRVPLPPQALRSVARCYIQAVDRNGDGRLALEEKQAHDLRFFEALNRDRDGRLTLAESKAPPDAKAIGPQPVCH